MTLFISSATVEDFSIKAVFLVIFPIVVVGWCSSGFPDITGDVSVAQYSVHLVTSSSFLPSYCHLFFAVVVVHTGAVVSYIKDVAVVLIMGVFVVVAFRWCFAALLFVVVVVVVAVGPRADVVNVAALTALYVVATSVDIVGGV